jgi:hypothetical protein
MNQPMMGKAAASSSATAPRTNALASVISLDRLVSRSPIFAASPLAPSEAKVRAMKMIIQAINFVGPNGSTNKITTGMAMMAVASPPAKKHFHGVRSSRSRARSTLAGKSSHHAVSIPGKAMPSERRIPKRAEMSAII